MKPKIKTNAMDSKVPKIEKRQFLGKTEKFKDNKERHFYQRMLKAYLKGKHFFYFGFTDRKNKFGVIERVPARYEVMCSVKVSEDVTNLQYENSLNKVSGKVWINKIKSKKEVRNLIKSRKETV